MGGWVGAVGAVGGVCGAVMPLLQFSVTITVTWLFH